MNIENIDLLERFLETICTDKEGLLIKFLKGNFEELKKNPSAVAMNMAKVLTKLDREISKKDMVNIINGMQLGIAMLYAISVDEKALKDLKEAVKDSENSQSNILDFSKFKMEKVYE